VDKATNSRAHDTFSICGRNIGSGHPPFLIAEIAQAHDGSLGMAHAFVDAAAEAGADAVKFQTHIATAESTLDEPFRVRFSRQDQTRYDYWRRMEFSPEHWLGLSDHARERNLVFLSSAFSVEAIELLEKIGVPAWKVGSGEFSSSYLIEAMTATKLPIIFSTGMCTYEDVSRAVHRIVGSGSAIALLQCTSKYPTPLTEVGLNVMNEYRRRFGCPVGLSDHSGTIWPGIATIMRGFDLVEAHLTLDRRMFGPDTTSSLTIAEFRRLSEARSSIWTMDANPIDKDSMARELSTMRSTFTKSVAPSRELSAGTVLTAEMLTMKKPGGGIPESDLPRLVGKRLRRSVNELRILTWDDVQSDS